MCVSSLLRSVKATWTRNLLSETLLFYTRVKIGVSATYLTRHESDFDVDVFLGFQYALVGFDHVVAGGCRFDLVDYVPGLRGVGDF